MKGSKQWCCRWGT